MSIILTGSSAPRSIMLSRLGFGLGRGDLSYAAREYKDF
jgi:hypothetical protein